MLRERRTGEPLVSVDYSSLANSLSELANSVDRQSRRISQLEDDLQRSRDEVSALRQRLPAAARPAAYGARVGQAAAPSADVEEVLREVQSTQSELHELRKRTAQAVCELRQGTSTSSHTSEVANELTRTQEELHELRKRTAQAFSTLQRQIASLSTAPGPRPISAARSTSFARSLLRTTDSEAPRGRETLETLAEDVRATREGLYQLAAQFDAGEDVATVRDELHELRKRTAQAVFELRRRVGGASGVASAATGDEDSLGYEPTSAQEEIHELRKRIAAMLGPERPGDPNKIVALQDEIEGSRQELHSLRQRISSVLAPAEGQIAGNRLDAIEGEVYKTQDEVHALRERVAQAFQSLRASNKPADAFERSLAAAVPDDIEEESYECESDASSYEAPPVIYARPPSQKKHKKPVVPPMKAFPKERPPSAGMTFATPRSARATPRSLALESRIQAAEAEINHLTRTLKNVERTLGGKADASHLQNALKVLHQENQQLAAAVTTEDGLGDKLEQMSQEVTGKVEDLRKRIEMLGQDVREGQREIIMASTLGASLGASGPQPTSSLAYEAPMAHTQPPPETSPLDKYFQASQGLSQAAPAKQYYMPPTTTFSGPQQPATPTPTAFVHSASRTAQSDARRAGGAVQSPRKPLASPRTKTLGSGFRVPQSPRSSSTATATGSRRPPTGAFR